MKLKRPTNTKTKWRVTGTIGKCVIKYGTNDVEANNNLNIS